MRLFRLLAPVLLAFTMVLGAVSAVAAQDQTEATPEDIPAGLEQWYTRTYSADIFSMMDPASPEAMPEGWFLLNANVLTFDSEENAKAGADQLLAELDSEVDDAESDLQLEDAELDLDFDYTAKKASQEEDGMTSVVIEAVAQDGNNVYAVIGITLGPDPSQLTEYAMQTMHDAEASDDAETFNADGASEGGLWAMLPAAEDIQSQESTLTIVEDAIYYPAPEGESTPAA